MILKINFDLVHYSIFIIRRIRNRDVLSPLDIQGLEIVSQLLHVGDSDGNVRHNQVIITVYSWTSLDQMKVQVAHAQPCSMPINITIVNYFDLNYFLLQHLVFGFSDAFFNNTKDF